MKIDLKKNYIFCGDNLDWLNEVPDKSIDLCYIDPPFFSNRNFEIIWGNGYERRAFEDRFSGRVSNYIEWMRPRIELIHKKLKSTGSIYLHCDWHASHRLRCVLDDIFDSSNFINEIIWKRVKTVKNNHKQGRRGLDPNTDTIFIYGKSNNTKLKQLFTPYSKEYIENTFRYIEEGTGRRYRINTLLGPGGAAKGNAYYEVMGVKKHWRYTKEKMQLLIDQGVVIQSKPGATPQRKQYLDEGMGVPIQTLWDDVHFGKGENLGYPTQKPEALLRRIVEMSTDEGDVILDCFAGGGTSAKVSSDMKRHFIIGDVSPVAIKIISERLYFDCPEVAFEIKNLPQTDKELMSMNGHEFAETVCEVMGWKVNAKKSGDGGVDAWAGDKVPVQVKNHAKSPAGRPDMQKFVGALQGQRAKKGIFVAWKFSRDAKEFIADMKRDHKIEITPMECSEVFGGLLLDSSKSIEIERLYKEKRPKHWSSKASKASHESVIQKVKVAKKKTGQGRRKKEVNQ